jgi:hypothetical protein
VVEEGHIPPFRIPVVVGVVVEAVDGAMLALLRKEALVDSVHQIKVIMVEAAQAHKRALAEVVVEQVV